MRADLRLAVLLVAAIAAVSVLGAARRGRDLVPARPGPIVRVDLNRATAEELAALPVLGIERARRIVAARRGRGGFASVDELLEVPGVGAKTLDRLRPHLTIVP
jgi:competence ComEA-like helix-hairpin-helix protein